MQNTAIPTNPIFLLGIPFFFCLGSQTSCSLKPEHYGLSEWSTLRPVLHAESLSLSDLWFGHLPDSLA